MYLALIFNQAVAIFVYVCIFIMWFSSRKDKRESTSCFFVSAPHGHQILAVLSPRQQIPKHIHTYPNHPKPPTINIRRSPAPHLCPMLQGPPRPRGACPHSSRRRRLVQPPVALSLRRGDNGRQNQLCRVVGASATAEAAAACDDDVRMGSRGGGQAAASVDSVGRLSLRWL